MQSLLLFKSLKFFKYILFFYSYGYRKIVAVIIFFTSGYLIYAQPAIPRPVFNSFQQINLFSKANGNNSNSYSLQNKSLPNYAPPLGATAEDIILQSQLQARQQMGVMIPGQSTINKQWQIDEVHQLLNEEKKNEHESATQRFQHYLNLFLQLNPDNFSITKAVYLSEAVHYNACPPYQDFEKAIKQKAYIVKQILKKEGLSENKPSAVNYAIQSLFSRDNIIRNPKTGRDSLVKRISYDFNDFFGEKDWRKMFVSKLLQTNSGQCHSLPLLYLCIAEQLHTRAYLSLAPNHSFIQFFDNKGKLNNFETTNGHVVLTSWMMQSEAISSIAYKNETYLDTLSSKELFAQCLADFQMSYIMMNGYDRYTMDLSQVILKTNSKNISALMTNSNFALYQFWDILDAFGNPPFEKFNQYPKLVEAYNNMRTAQEKVNQTGYQDMPREQYVQWLKSIEIEKQKLNKNLK